MNIRFTQWISIVVLLLSSNSAWTQSQTHLDIALRYVEKNYESWNLTEADIQDMIVSDMYTNRNNGTSYIYFNQSYKGVKLQNAIINLSVLNNGQVISVGKRFTPDIASQIQISTAKRTSDEALVSVIESLGINKNISRSKEVKASTKFLYEGGTFSVHDVHVELLYKKINNQLRLVWEVGITPIHTSENWAFSIDANTGEILEKRNLVIRCQFGDKPFHRHGEICETNFVSKKTFSVKETLTQVNEAMVSGYRVFELPTMSPNNGDHVMVNDPFDLVASPNGWHDIDGEPGAEFTVTRGNNVNAFLDRNDDGASDMPQPNGGMDLIFDFPYDPNAEPLENANAAVTNLFYATNLIHDFAYVNGFDEAAGNFQFNNFDNGGEGNDIMTARAQAGADSNLVNNAQYTGGPDGDFGRINMFVWDETQAVQGLLNITSPETVAGQYNTGGAAFGMVISDVPIIGEIVEVNDNVYMPYITDGCQEFINTDMEGKIALVDRGGCSFELKAVNAEAAGAIALLVCNFESDPVGNMGDLEEVENPTIPAISIGATDCATIRQFAGTGLMATIVQPVEGTGPDLIDGDFDNGIIIHEYAHGISNRLTGGPANVNCLYGVDTDLDDIEDDGEQMGEGWSDFFSLAMTVKEGDTGEMKRGMGTFIQRQPITATGIRTYPYSTDMSINPHTYGSISTESYPHGVGSVWCAILWDLYWAMVDKHDFDNDLFNGNGGNNRAVRLIIEGMKLQPCSPGFVDGRTGILDADMNLYGGENQCLIWEVFARRGVGVDAVQGSTLTRFDQVENFESLATCIAELKIEKSMTQLIDAGEDIDVGIKVINHQPEQLTGLVVTDILEPGSDYIAGSCSLGEDIVTVDGNTLTFEIGSMDYLDEIEFSYQVSTVEENFSIRNFYDDVEAVDFDFWFPIPVEEENFWEVSTIDQNSGSASWFVENIDERSQQILQVGQESNQIMISGDQPVLRFFHNYNTEAAVDGGIVEVSTDGGTFWNSLGDKMFRGEYRGLIQYVTFVIPNLSAFHGSSDGWISTYVDLSDYEGEEIVLRWNFATDDNTSPNGGGGWYVDDIELMDMFNYNSEVCVDSDQGASACTKAGGRGTVVESQLTVAIDEPVSSKIAMNIFPNPTDTQLNLSITTPDNQQTTLSILTLDGRAVQAKVIETSLLTRTIAMDVSSLPAGFYFVKASTNQGSIIEKVVIH